MIDNAHIVLEPNGTYSAFVRGAGFASGVSLPYATRFIRENAGVQTGAVRCRDASTGEWTSEVDIAEGA